ncbi:MAG: mannosyltransferase [Calothrix sp. MO_167.B42]|nr:mannosyltransferase [Calothrix sp. MO_167.B42]
MEIHRRFSSASLLLAVFIFLALFLRIICAFLFPNVLWPDEIFQTLEPAHRLSFGHGIISWEFRDGIRSWVFPAVLAKVMSITKWLGDGSSGYLAGVKIFLCLISLIPVLVAFFWGQRLDGLVGGAIAAGVCCIWFELIYFAPKAFNEVLAAHLLLPGVYLGTCHQYSLSQRRRLFFAGCLCGLALCLRIHLLPAIAFFVAYICRRNWQKKWLPMVAGIIAPVLLFGTVDAFTWSYPFQSFWLNIWVNAIEGKSSSYGVSPWYEYLWELIKSWIVAIIPITFLVIRGVRRSPILGWLVVIIILSHSAIAHKEYRFIYPAVLMIIFLAGLGTADVVLHLRPQWLVSKGTKRAVLICMLIWCFFSAVLPLASSTTHWRRYAGNLRAFQMLSIEKNLCGVGIWGMHWSQTGGYAYLHQNVPLFMLENQQDFDKYKPNFNYVVGKKKLALPPQHQDYTVEKCWKRTCLYKSQTSCQVRDGYDFNQVMKQRGE